MAFPCLWGERTVGIFESLFRAPQAKARRRSQPRRDAADQLRLVMAAPFQRARLMSRAEFDLFKLIEAHLPRCGPGFRLMAQPSVGEFVETSDPEAYRAINARRVDMLVIDTFGFPVAAVEHQGGGHYQAGAAARDAIKREVLRKAGIEYVEIFDYHDGEEVRRLVSAALQRNRPPASPNAVPPRPAGR
ncbi:hypothetical protein DMC47_04790 [Nostoc sp. 3335mG]|nr:hypothetical protein DMC47_04790 [Nostoc sp. 3335mG]